MRNKLPPIKDIYGRNLNKIDLLSKNDSDFDKLFNKNQKKYDDYFMAIKIGEILKYKFH